MLFQDPSEESSELSDPRTTTPIWSTSRPRGDTVSLEEASLLLGPLKPEAVCRIGREIARVLARVHADEPGVDGGLTAGRIQFDRAGHVRLAPPLSVVDEPRLISPERRGTRIPAEPSDDLYALGVLVAEAALGHPLEAHSRYLDVRIFDGALPERLVDAIAALVAPPGKRLTNAAAALRMFADMEPRFGDGARALGEAVDAARLGVAFGGLGSSLEGGDDEEGPITVPDPSPTIGARPVDAQTASPFRAHEIAFFARGIVIAPLPVAARTTGRSFVPAALGALAGFVLVGALAFLTPWQRLASEAETRTRAWLDAVAASMAPVVVVPPAKAIVDPTPPPSPTPTAQPDVASVAPLADPAPVLVTTVVTTAVPPAKVKAAAPAQKKAAPKPARAVAAVAPVVAEEGPAVKLIVDASPAVRARAENALRACAINGPILGALHVKNKKLVKVSSDPANGCVERVLLRTLPGYRQDEPFEIELR